MDDGIAFFEEQINQNPFSDAAWYNQGILYNQAGLFEKALDAFEYALLIRPDLSMAHFNRANTFINLEKYPEALEQMQEAIHCEPDYPLFVNGLGVCYEKLNRIDEALARYEAAAVLDPLLADAWFGQAACKAQSESWSAALVLINRALELAADHEEYWYEKGRILMALARYDEAEQVLAEALRLDEGFWEARILLVSLFLAVDRYEDALRCIQDGQEPHKDDAAYFFELAGLIFAFEIKELLDLAHTCLQWALSVDPSESHHLLTFWPDAHNNKEIVALLREYKALD
jgi:tetratricopeptide (TPR) repeat protein